MTVINGGAQFLTILFHVSYDSPDFFYQEMYFLDCNSLIYSSEYSLWVSGSSGKIIIIIMKSLQYLNSITYTIIHLSV